MVIILKTFWKGNIEPSSTGQALRDTLHQANAWKDAQCIHYNEHGFRVEWKVYSHYAVIAEGQSKPRRK